MQPDGQTLKGFNIVVGGGMGRTPSWLRMAFPRPEDGAPSASLGHLKAQAAPVHPRAPPEHRAASPRAQEPGSGRPKVEERPRFPARHAP